MTIKTGDFVLTSLPAGKKSYKLFGHGKNLDSSETEVQFLKRVRSKKEVLSAVNENDIDNKQIVKTLTCPCLTKREQYCFKKDLTAVP